MMESIDQGCKQIGPKIDHECEQVTGRRMQRQVDKVETVAVELPEGFQPSFALNGVSGDSGVGGIGRMETRGVENAIRPAELFQKRNCTIYKRANFLGRPERTNDLHGHLGIDRAYGPDFRLPAPGPNPLKNHGRNRFMYFGLEPLSISVGFEPCADGGDGRFRGGGRELLPENRFDQLVG